MSGDLCDCQCRAGHHPGDGCKRRASYFHGTGERNEPVNQTGTATLCTWPGATPVMAGAYSLQVSAPESDDDDSGEGALHSPADMRLYAGIYRTIDCGAQLC